MNKKELIEKTTEILKKNNIRKPISAQKTVLHISDDDGNCKNFVIKKSATGLLFTEKDVTMFLEALLTAVEDTVKKGDKVSIPGFGYLSLNLRAARTTVHPKTGEAVNVEAHYVPKFTSGVRLKTAAKVYESDLSSKKESGD